MGLSLYFCLLLTNLSHAFAHPAANALPSSASSISSTGLINSQSTRKTSRFQNPTAATNSPSFSITSAAIMNSPPFFLTSAVAESTASSQLNEFNSAPPNTTLTVGGTPIVLQKQILPGFANLTGVRTIITSVPTATASGGAVAYANGPIVVGPGGAVWGVSSGSQGGGVGQQGGAAREGIVKEILLLEG